MRCTVNGSPWRIVHGTRARSRNSSALPSIRHLPLVCTDQLCDLWRQVIADHGWPAQASFAKHIP
jgi:hypothetical protein